MTAQPRYHSELTQPDKEGFWSICLTPEAMGRAESDFSDFRLLDPKGKEVPYIIRLQTAACDTLQNKANQQAKTIQTKLPVNKIRISNRDKNTVTSLYFTEKILISSVRFYISAPRFYNRKITFCAPEEETGQTTDNRWDGRTHTLNSSDTSSLEISCRGYADKMGIVIHNEDNPPLQIDSILCYSDNYELIAWLKDSTSYSLTYGDSLAKSPAYDLACFTSKIPLRPDQLTITTTTRKDIKTFTPPAPDGSFMTFVKKFGIWAIIIVVSLQILYTVWKITRKK